MRNPIRRKPAQQLRAKVRFTRRRRLAAVALAAVVVVAANLGYGPAGGVVFGFVVLTPLERLFRRHAQPVRRPGLRTDIVHLLVSSALAPVLSIASFIVAYLVTRPMPRLDGVVGAWPFAARALWALLWIEVLVYWAHRLSHELPWYWRFHKVHHSSSRLDWISGARAHPLEQAIGVALIGPFALVLGVQPVEIGAVAAVQAVLGVLLHANVRWRLRPLDRIVSNTEFHHWHHSLGEDARDANYAAFLPVLDIIFGTYHMPRDARPERYGIPDHMPAGWWAQVKDPFRRRQRHPTIPRLAFDAPPAPF